MKSTAGYFLVFWCFYLITVDRAACQACNQSVDCKNPLGSQCVNWVCTCKEGFSLYLDNYCLERIIDRGYCWITDQCLIPGSHCLQPNAGKELTRIKESLWRRYVNSSYSKTYIPGDCGCPRGFRYDARRNSCVVGLLGKSCQSQFDCYDITLNSQCIGRKCICSDSYLYDDETNECLFVSSVSSACTANVFGFIISMAFLLILWLGVWNWQKNRHLRNHRHWSLEQISYSNLLLRGLPSGQADNTRRQSLDPRLWDSGQDEAVGSLEEDKPPTYEEAVRNLQSSQIT